MRKINRNINLALIFTLLALFFCAKIGFALPEHALRPNLISSYNGRGERLSRAARQLSDRVLVLNNQGLLSQLSEQRRKTLTHLFIEGKTQKETAEIMGITQQVVSKHKQLALARLRELISPVSNYQVVQNNQNLLSQLSEQQRRVLTYIFIEGKTGTETAGIMGITRETVSSDKLLALARLRELIDPGSDYQVVLNNQNLLSRLSEQRRRVLTYLFIEGKTQEETAGIMGITQEAVSEHKLLALARLRELTKTMPLITINKSARESI